MSNNNERLVLENYDNKFLYEKNKSNLNITFNRIAFIFFIFLVICIIYTIKVFYLGSLNSKIKIEKNSLVKKNYINDIIDNDEDFIAKAINTQTVGINPNLIIDEKKLLINLQIIFPEKDFSKIKKKIKEKKYFRIQKGLNQNQIQRLQNLGDKAIEFEEQLTRVYPQQNLFSHIIGQIDDDNNGISGLEKSFDEVQDEIQILSPQKKGTAGIDALNIEIQNRLTAKGKPIFQGKRSTKLYPKDRVMQTSNDYSIEVMNGEIGAVHSTDNAHESWEYIDICFPNEVESIRKEFYSLAKVSIFSRISQLLSPTYLKHSLLFSLREHMIKRYLN